MLKLIVDDIKKYKYKNSENYNINKIAEDLNMNFRTVKKYLVDFGFA